MSNSRRFKRKIRRNIREGKLAVAPDGRMTAAPRKRTRGAATGSGGGLVSTSAEDHVERR